MRDPFDVMVDVVWVGLLLVAAGVVAIFLGILGSPGRGGSHMKGAGFVLVGPIPIVFGSDAKWASITLALAITLVVVMLILYVI